MNRDGYASDLLVTPQRKAELTSRFAQYMAESLQDNQLLYYILHYTLEMSHVEIEALGFALSEHYETEEPEAKPSYGAAETVCDLHEGPEPCCGGPHQMEASAEPAVEMKMY